MAALHARCFTLPRPWSEQEFQQLLADKHNFVLVRPQAFLLGRVVLDQSELLTLAVAPELRRKGLGHALVTEFLQKAHAAGAKTHYLEVASDNAAALNLYRKQQWRPVGVRKNYYGPASDAIVMALDCAKNQEHC